MNAPIRQTTVKISRAIQGVLSLISHRRSKLEPTQYQRIGTSNNDGRFATDSGCQAMRFPPAMKATNQREMRVHLSVPRTCRAKATHGSGPLSPTTSGLQRRGDSESE